MGEGATEAARMGRVRGEWRVEGEEKMGGLRRK